MIACVRREWKTIHVIKVLRYRIRVLKYTLISIIARYSDKNKK